MYFAKSIDTPYIADGIIIKGQGEIPKKFCKKIIGYNHSSETVCTAIVNTSASQLPSTEPYFLEKFLIQM